MRDEVGVRSAFQQGRGGPERKADHLCRANAEVKNAWSCTSPAAVCHH
jgi:hypothetical protein